MNPSSDGRFSPPNKERVLEEKGQSHPDANVDETVDVAAFGGFLHQGEICMSTRGSSLKSRSPRNLPKNSSRRFQPKRLATQKNRTRLWIPISTSNNFIRLSTAWMQPSRVERRSYVVVNLGCLRAHPGLFSEKDRGTFRTREDLWQAE